MSKYQALVIVGESAVGKDTLYNRLLSLNLGLKPTISHTTRPKRENETEGKDYHFISDKEFDEMLKNNKFIETRTYQTKDLWRYGLSKQALLDNTEYTSLIILDIQGLQQLEQAIGKDNIYSIFLTGNATTRLIRSIQRQNVEINREYTLSKDHQTLQEIVRRYYDDARVFAKATDMCNKSLVNETEEDLENNIEYIKNLIR